MDVLDMSDISICKFSPLTTPVHRLQSKKVNKTTNKVRLDSNDVYENTKKKTSTFKSVTTTFLASSSDDSDSDVSSSKGDNLTQRKRYSSSDPDSDVSSIKGGNRTQIKRKRDNYALPCSLSDKTESIPSKNTQFDKRQKTFTRCEVQDAVVDDLVDDEIIQSVSEVSIKQTKHKKLVKDSLETSKNKIRYKPPDDFIIDTNSKYLTQKDIKGKKLFTISVPSHVDISSLNGQTINMNGKTDISLTTDEGKSDFEVNTQLYPTDMKRFSSLCLKDGTEDDFRLGCQVTGYIDILPAIPLPPPIVFNKTKPKKHTVPDDLPYKLRPFGADSPPRRHEDNIVEDKPSKHKKKKKHKKQK